MSKMFTPDAFLKALSEGSLKGTLTRTGMVKKADLSDALLFAPGRACQNWIQIPAKMIERVEWLGKVPCKDHTHDFVRLHLVPPDIPEAEVLVALLQTDTELPMDPAHTLFGSGELAGITGGISRANPYVASHVPFEVGATGAGQDPSSFTGVKDLAGGAPATGILGPPEPDIGEDLFPGLLRFPGSTFTPCTPSYGHWCGNCRTSTPNDPGVDAVDAVCRAHDLCIDANGHHCDCDRAFIAGMAAAFVAPGVSAQGRTYGTAAIAAFQVKPCFCYKRVLGRRIKVWGIGGRCPF